MSAAESQDDPIDFDVLAEAVESRVLLADQHRLRRLVQQVRGRLSKQQPVDRSLKRLADNVATSVAIFEKREQLAPAATLEQSLPISEYADEIKAAITENQVVIVCGETGSGKSTQLPKLCLQLGRGRRGLIGHTQPRRIAARSIASRLSDEMGTALGTAVGYQVRFQDRTREDTLVKLMTDGILLAETQGDKFLSKYDTLIIDEAHERSLNIDFLLGYIKRLLPKRPDLKLIITSATLDAERFAAHFAPASRADSPADESQQAPVISVPGRTYPVEIRYRPVESDDDKPNRQSDWMGAAVASACDAARSPITDGGVGDVLVFLPTERDIRDLAETLRGRLSAEIQSNRIEVLPLYGRLSVEAQNKVFAPTKARRIVLATNVAESSLTVPNIRTVVDPGLARISRFAAKSKVQRLPIEPVSKASCDQRAGRCGRVGPGICIRLYSQADYNNREDFTPPEILRTNLASVILQIESLGLGQIEDFPFIEPPRQQAVIAGTKTLFELGAFDDSRRLTEIGRQLSRMPVDPRIGRMLLAAHDEGCLHDMLIIAAALEVRDPRDRPVDKQQAADERHAQFIVEGSDFMTLLSLWTFIHDLERSLSKSKFRKALSDNFLSYVRVREWEDVHRQLKQLVRELGWKETRFSEEPAEPANDQRRKGRGNRPPKKAKATKREDAIHRSVLAGMLSNLGMKADERREYAGVQESRFVLWPGSVLAKAKPKWIVAAEQVETEQRYARCIGPVAPEWIEPLAKHLVTLSQFEPHYSENANAAMVYERVSLWGLTIVPKRRTRLSNHDPAAAHDLFVREGLAAGRYESKGDFQRKNRELFERIAAWQDKTRRADMLLGEDAAFDFYKERVPEFVSDGRTFEKWRREAEATNPGLLVMQSGDLMAEDEFSVSSDEFPDELAIGTLRYPLRYSHNPGGDRDGVSLVIPREAAGQIDRSRLGWLVPGLLEEKVAALLRTLPKENRRQLVPIPESAKELYAEIKFGEGDLLDQLGLLLRRKFGIFAPPESFGVARLPAHLQMGVTFADEVESRDGSGLQTPTVPDDDPDEYGGVGFTSWTFGDLPESITQRRGGLPVVFRPALIDDGDSVSLRLMSDAGEATRSTMAGLTRLFLLAERDRIRKQIQHFPQVDRMRLLGIKFGLEPKLDSQLAWVIASKAVFAKATIPRTEAAWNERLALAKNQISVAVQDMARWLGPMFNTADEVHRLLAREKRPAFQTTIHDVHEQFAMLLAADVLINSPVGWLPHVERHLRAIKTRLGKLESGGLNRDRQTTASIAARWQELQHWWQTAPAGPKRPTALVQYRWLFEEYRVLRFAQEVGTVGDISEKKITEARGLAASALQQRS